MKVSLRARIYFIFCSGFLCGIIIGSSFGKSRKIASFSFQTDNHHLYDDSLSRLLEKEVKVLCWVFTHPANHETRSIHVKNTWGKRCNKLLFMSSEEDPRLPEIVVIPGKNGRVHLWKKTQLVYRYVSGPWRFYSKFHKIL
jgi:hypothetical protein